MVVVVVVGLDNCWDCPVILGLFVFVCKIPLVLTVVDDDVVEEDGNGGGAIGVSLFPWDNRIRLLDGISSLLFYKGIYIYSENKFIEFIYICTK